MNVKQVTIEFWWMNQEWTSTDRQVPRDLQEVLIRIGEHIMLAVYRGDEECFVLRDNHFVKICEGKIFWAPLMPPGEE